MGILVRSVIFEVTVSESLLAGSINLDSEWDLHFVGMKVMRAIVLINFQYDAGAVRIQIDRVLE